MKHIYVDYSVKFEGKGTNGGVAVLVKEGGNVTTHFYKTQKIGSDKGELVALLLGLKYASEGDVVYTDQDWLVDKLLEHGQFMVGKTGNRLKKKLIHSLNTVLTFKRGVAIVGVKQGHCGSKEWGHVDGCAKVAAGLRNLCKDTWRHYGEHNFTVNKLMYV